MMLEVAAELVAEPRHILDLACGTGSITQLGLKRFPAAQVVAQDADPLLMTIGRATLDEAVAGSPGSARTCAKPIGVTPSDPMRHLTSWSLRPHFTG